MIIQQIGNGGAFDYNKTNSSFLINLGTEKHPLYLLFDCGNNVFAKLRKMEVEQNIEIIKYIDHVFISHFDDDHDGSLKTLGYYRYFMLGKTTNILCNPLASELAERLKGINKKIIFGNFRPAEIFNFVENFNNLITNVGFKIIKGTHHTEAYGLLIGKVFSKVFTDFVYISGDTKVNENIIEIIENVKATIAHAEYLPLTHDIDLLKNSYKILINCSRLFCCRSFCLSRSLFCCLSSTSFNAALVNDSLYGTCKGCDRCLECTKNICKKDFSCWEL